MRVRRLAQGGFTLAEILVVLVILGLLAGIVFTRVAGQTERARVQTARAQVAALEEAVRRFEADNGFFPETEQGLEALVEKPAAGRAPTNYADGGYLDRGVPADPWGNPYKYLAPGARNRDFDLWSAGPDGADGTDDDVGNW
jgi:general secretion pathway protein G